MDKMTNRILQLLHRIQLACRPQIGKPGLTRWHACFKEAGAIHTSCGIVIAIELHMRNLVLQRVALAGKLSHNNDNNNNNTAAMKPDYI